MDILDNDGNAPSDLLIDWRSTQVREEIGRLKLERLRSNIGCAGARAS
jgi:hypothetical protein